ncbi:MAG: hypothetical protein JNL32_06040, partial [Candidatus Kapabacteria bacterium]|nr:hypothetical protein [Candidatus Kapabacteria bacterium]
MKRSSPTIILVLLGIMLGYCTADAQWTNWNWRRLTMPAGFADSYFLDVMFLPANPQFGWACGHGGRVVRTTDGGATWRGVVIPAGDQLESIIFVNERVGYVSGSDNFQQGKGGIFKSTDGGATWNEITPVINDRGGVRRAHLWGNYFINENVGITVGGGCDEVQQFYRTSDGGATWSVFLGSTPASGMSHVIMYSENGLCYASSSGRLWRSQDGGRTFTDWVSTGGQQFWQENLSNKGNAFLVGFAGKDCFGVGQALVIFHATTDGGATWKITPVRGSIFGTFLLNERTGWAVGFQNGVYRTSDGGETFEEYNCGLPAGSNWDDIWFVNDTLGFLAGDGLYMTIPELAPPQITSTDPNVCEGDSITLTLNRNYPVIRWSTGARTQSITVGASGDYYARVSDSSLCEKTSNIIRVRVNPRPRVSIATTGRYFHICFGDSLTIGIASPYPTMLWNTGERTQSITVRTAGTYSVTVIDTNGCTSSDSIRVTGGAPIVPLITATRFRVCEGDTVVLSASPGFAEYQWSNGARSSSIAVT